MFVWRSRSTNYLKNLYLPKHVTVKDCKVLTGSSYVINSSILENTLTITDGELSATKNL